MTTAFICVRMGSSRLPGKALLPILGKPMLERMIERVKTARAIDDIVIATTTLPDDDELARLAERLDVGCYRGSVDDVLGRLAGAVVSAGCDIAVELLGDNPLVDPRLLDATVARFLDSGQMDYVATVTNEHHCAGPALARFPIGVRVEVYRREALVRVAEEAVTPYNRENATSFFWESSDSFRLGFLEADGPWAAANEPDMTFAVNYEQNYLLVREVFQELFDTNPCFGLGEVIGVIDRRPELLALMGAP